MNATWYESFNFSGEGEEDGEGREGREGEEDEGAIYYPCERNLV